MPYLMRSRRRNRIFVSYSDHDGTALEEFRTMMAPLVKTRSLSAGMTGESNQQRSGIRRSRSRSRPVASLICW